MKRGVFYLSLVIIAVLAINWKIAEIKTKRAKPTISIANEFEKFGKPVEVINVEKTNMIFSERLTGKVQGSKIILLVGQNQWRKISLNQNVKLVDSTNDSKLAVGYIAKNPETETGLFQVHVVSKNGYLEVKDGSVVVDVITSVKDDVISLKTTAIKTEDDNKYVWILTSQNEAEKRTVKTGFVSLYETQIVSGLTPGEKVIIRGASSLKKNTKVRIAKLGDVK